MAYLGTGDVQTWLEQTKLTVGEIEAALEQLFAGSVIGQMASRYDTTTWLDEGTTPSLVRQVVGMLYAAAIYRRQYSEDLQENPAWPVWLETTANMMIAQIVSGVIDLPVVVTPEPTGLNEPIFYPNDESSNVDIGNDPPAFSMAKVF